MMGDLWLYLAGSAGLLGITLVRTAGRIIEMRIALRDAKPEQRPALIAALATLSVARRALAPTAPHAESPTAAQPQPPTAVEPEPPTTAEPEPPTTQSGQPGLPR